MAEAATVARPYAEAVFVLADAASALARWSEMLATMAAVSATPEMTEAAGNPRLSPTQLYGVFAGASGDITKEAQNLAHILIENRRLGLLPEIREIFEELKNEREGVIDAVITSAFPLEPRQLAEIVAELERRFKRKIEPQVELDAALIGGVRMQVGDEVIDGSVRGKLAGMASALMMK